MHAAMQTTKAAIDLIAPYNFFLHSWGSVQHWVFHKQMKNSRITALYTTTTGSYSRFQD